MGLEVATIAAITMGVGGMAKGGLDIWSGFQGQREERQQGEAQSAMARYNQEVAEGQAASSLQMAESERLLAKERKKRLHGQNVRTFEKQRALMSKSGVLPEGTPLLVQQEQLAEMTLSELDVLHEGEMRAYPHEVAAAAARSRGDYYDWQGQVAEASGGGGNRSLLSGFTQMGIGLLPLAAMGAGAIPWGGNGTLGPAATGAFAKSQALRTMR